MIAGETKPLRVLIAGAGPAGAACAISLLRLAAQAGRQVQVDLFEHKQFGRHYNQCMGVLSPPIQELLTGLLGLEIPESLILRRIYGYCLHTESTSIRLQESEAGGGATPSLATRRVQFDAFLNESACRAGAALHPCRVCDVEFGAEAVNIFTEGGSFSGDILVGAFGLDCQMSEALERRIGYRRPDYLDTVVTKIHPGQERVDAFGDTIHAFLVATAGVEFASLVPKGNHITALVAGRKVSSFTLRQFLGSQSVRQLLDYPFEVSDMFRGSFPISPARNFYCDRFIAIGDAAGLVRPFKGKGINSALLCGSHVAGLILERGVTRQALSGIERCCAEIIGDLWYGRATRLITGVMTRLGVFDPVLATARRSPALRRALFDSVSGQDTYRNVWRRILGSPADLLRVSAGVAAAALRHTMSCPPDRS
ncbi:hypothetical protein LLH00_08525 [bacterium]|nr:hypothetical protein [bacterium]